MPTRIDVGQNSSHRRGTEGSNRTEFGIATLWLVFYALALGVRDLIALDFARDRICCPDCRLMRDNSRCV